MKKLSLLLFIVLTSLAHAELSHIQAEIALTNSDKECICYYDVDVTMSGSVELFSESVIRTYSGLAIGYTKQDWEGIHVYTFGGKHVGWLVDGLFYDNDGYVIAVPNLSPTNEPVKYSKQTEGIKWLTHLSPLKPSFSLQWSNNNLFTLLEQ